MRDEPLPLALFHEALDLLHRLAARPRLAADPEVRAIVAELALMLPALQAQDWRQHRARSVEG